MEPGHLLHSALTRPPGEYTWHLNSRQLFVLVVQQLITSSDDNNRNAALWADDRWKAEWLEFTTRFCTSTSAHTHVEWTLPTYTSRVWRILRLVSVGQKNSQLTMLSFTVQSIDVPMEWMD